MWQHVVTVEYKNKNTFYYRIDWLQIDYTLQSCRVHIINLGALKKSIF